MRILVDTCVLSEVHNPHGDRGVRSAFAALAPSETFLSVITLGEIQKGVILLPDGAKKRGLEDWLRMLQQEYVDRIVPIAPETALLWGEITARAARRGHQIPVSDGLIAAAAIQHGCRVMTRNVKHFGMAGVLIVNPWAIND